MPRSQWLTRANFLTAVRLVCGLLLFRAIAERRETAAFALFWLAVATDLADGWVARRYAEATPLGGLADHAVDAAFVVLGTAALAHAGVLPAVLSPLIAAAFLQYAVDSRWLGGASLRPSPLGRWNGIAYFVIVGIPVVRDALGLGWPGPELVSGLGLALVVTTVLSMADRIRRLARTRRAPGSPA